MFERPTRQDFYQILEIGYDATAEDIKQAYDEARRIYAHDAMVAGTVLTEDERRATFRRISEAYQTLIAEESRRLYDLTLVRSMPALSDVERAAPLGDREGFVDAGKAVPGVAEPSPIMVRFNPPVIDMTTKLKDEQRREAFPRLVKPVDPEHIGEVTAATPLEWPASDTEPAEVAAEDPELAVGEEMAVAGLSAQEKGSLSAADESESDEEILIPDLGPSDEASGDFLRSVRTARGVTLEQISRQTKISMTMLEDIESERLDRLPAAIYLRNFTGQMAEMLGLDASQVSRTYLTRVGRLRGE